MRLILPAALLPVLAASAGEIVIESKPFVIERTLSAVALPAAPMVLRVDAESWPSFEIKKVAPHGSRVAAGDTLIEFDTTSLDRKLEDGRKALDASNLSMAQAEVELRSLKDNFPLKMDAAKRAARNASDDLNYFKAISRKSAEERSQETLKRSKQALENEQEELRQLEKMYKADDLTEETEEIILVRQRDAVATSEFALRMATLEQKRVVETVLPRQAEEFEAANTNATLILAKAESDLPRQIQLKEIEVAGGRVALARQKDDFAKLTADREKAQPVKAPAAGWFYYGAIEDGRWTPGESSKTLVPNGSVLAHKPFATFIPAASALGLIAFTDEAAVRSLVKKTPGIATVTGREELPVNVTLESIAEAPGTDGRYRVDLSAAWTADLNTVPGSTAQVRLTAYENPTAIAIPSAALKLLKDGWMVNVKLADGKSAPRPVKRGRISGDQVEILSGLEAGQVILTP